MSLPMPSDSTTMISPSPNICIVPHTPGPSMSTSTTILDRVVRFEDECVLIPDICTLSPPTKRRSLTTSTKSISLSLWKKKNHHPVSDSEAGYTSEFGTLGGAHAHGAGAGTGAGTGDGKAKGKLKVFIPVYVDDHSYPFFPSLPTITRLHAWLLKMW